MTRARHIAAFTLLAAMLPSAAAAQETPSTGPAAERLRRDPDDRGTGIRIGEHLIVGGRLTATFDDLHDGRLADRAERRSDLDSGAQLQVSWKPSRNIEAFGKIAGLQDATRVVPSAAWTSSGDLRVYEAFVLAHRVGGAPIDVQVGRQRIRDTREWFFDEFVDGARVRVTAGGWRVEGLLAQSLFAGPEPQRARHDKQHVILSVSRRVTSRTRVDGFFISRNDKSSRDDDPMWIGASFASTNSRATRFWLTTATRRGETAGNVLRGWALDAGVGRRMRWPLAPVFTIGFARASGDERPGDGIDSTFRQTGLEDNEGRFDGTKVFGYYGVLFAPELTNLQVFTAAATMHPRSRVSVDVVYHRYGQSVARAGASASALRWRTTGHARHLGDEVDAIASVRLTRAIDLNVMAGVFRAGTAFGTSATAFEWRPQIRVYF